MVRHGLMFAEDRLSRQPMHISEPVPQTNVKISFSGPGAELLENGEQLKIIAVRSGTNAGKGQDRFEGDCMIQEHCRSCNQILIPAAAQDDALAQLLTCTYITVGYTRKWLTYVQVLV